MFVVNFSQHKLFSKVSLKLTLLYCCSKHGLNLDVFIKDNLILSPLSILRRDLTQMYIQRRGRRMSFFAQSLTGSFQERNEFECLINRLLSLVKPPAFNQPNLFATTQWGQKKLICTADWTSFNLGKSFPHHHPAHNTTAGQRTKFYSLW